MRDVRRIRSTAQRMYLTYEPMPPCRSGTTPKDFTYESWSSGRSDITKSDGLRPTAYQAYRIKREALFFRRSAPTSTLCLVDGKTRRYFMDKVEQGYNPPPRQHVVTTVSGTPLVPSYLVTRAHTSLLSNLNREDVDLGESLAEVFKEAGKLSEILIRLGKALMYLKRGKPSKALKVLGLSRGNYAKGLSDWYLAWNFGVKPIVQTATGLDQAIRRTLHERDLLISVRGGAEETRSPDNEGTLTIASGSITCGVQCGAIYRVDNPTLVRLNKLGLINPLYLAWQLVPFSFIVDWFISISSFLNGLYAPMGFGFVSSYSTKYARSSIHWHRKPVLDWDSGDLNARISEFAMLREVGIVFRPGLTMSLGLNSGKAVTLAAIAIQLKG